jgi:hypothetical protein
MGVHNQWPRPSISGRLKGMFEDTHSLAAVVAMPKNGGYVGVQN